jgi:hypothetical protein
MGAAVAGRVVDSHGAQQGFALALLATVLAAVMAFVVRASRPKVAA